MKDSWIASIAFALLAGGFQLASAWMFNNIGRVDPTLARASVRRLLTTASRTSSMRKQVEQQFDTGNTESRRRTLGETSVALSFIEEDVTNSIFDWYEFHAEALRDLKESHDESE
jgi:hypothetical protein